MRRKFDSSSLCEADKNLLNLFFAWRKDVDRFLQETIIMLFSCPGCGFPTLEERGGYEICEVCGWEDDYQDDPKADEIWGGPNYQFSLTENRLLMWRELHALAQQLNGTVNTSPKEVLCILHERRHIVNAVRKKLKSNLHISEADYVKEWRKAEEDTLAMFIITK